MEFDERQVEDELDTFAVTPLLQMKVVGENEDGFYYNNPLDWWAENERRFPLLATLARRYLCIPATSAPSERLFSAAGLTIAKDRASLLPDVAQSLIFLHDVADAYLAQRI